MICPKCGAPWQTFTRSGMQVEQCSGCKGVFLDYGELERLVQAEGAYYGRTVAPAPPPVQPGYGQPQHVVHHNAPRHGHYSHGRYGHHHSFLGELFG